MSLDLHFELRLEERQTDRVFVSVVLAPQTDQPSAIDGVSVQMQDRAGEPLGPRMVLPLAGAVAQPLLTTVEVRARSEIPAAARVVGHVWRGSEQLDASCPCDPGTQLEVHMRGQQVISALGEVEALRSLDPDEREALGRMFPWVNQPIAAERPPPSVVDEPEPDPDDVVDEVADQFDLDDEDAAFLKELLGED